ncbi:MAG: hypothetical protein AAFN77_19060 [Planctomycetota bacterium]
MNKVDRSRLYGFKVQEVLDERDEPCELITLADDGRTLVGKGGTGIGYVDADGNWCDKSELKPVDLEGSEITPVPSSFAAPITLQDEVTIDQYLDHNIRLVYQLEPTDVTDALKSKLQSGVIFQFPYSYRGGLESDAGFLLTNADDEVFFLVGDPTNADFKGLQASPNIVATGDESSDGDGEDLMDFGMI